MKKIFGILLFIISISSYSQSKVDIWPVKGKQAGTDIIFKPQDHIGKELNFGNLYISIKEGTQIIAPKDGFISFIGYNYSQSLTYSLSFEFNPPATSNIIEYDIQRRNEIANTTDSVDSKFIFLSIGISTGDGETYYITGILPTKDFETGYKVKRGEVIGTAWYCYKRIPKACICIERSKNGIRSDPMSPFGLKTSFVPFKNKADFSVIHPVDDLKADFAIMRESLEEGHPGLYDYTTKEVMDKLFDETLHSISQPMSSEQFYNLLKPIFDSIRDSHTEITKNYPVPKSEIFCLPVFFGLLNDSVIINRTLPDYQKLLGKQIVKINNEKIESIIPKITFLNGRCDGYITSRKELFELELFHLEYQMSYNKKKGDTISLTFSDGTKTDLIYQPTSDNYIPSWKHWLPQNGNFETIKLNKETALLDINTFDLTKKDENNIFSFIKELADSSYKNIIIDIRDNRGGSADVAGLFSLFVKQPFQTQVPTILNKNLSYNFLKYCDNYNMEAIKLFKEQTIVKDLENKTPTEIIPLHKPNDSIHFDGNIYVLTNEFSVSASTILAALVHKYKRGVIVGRETASGYYQMNAAKFANITLPNSGVGLRIPLSKFTFEYKGNSDIPWGRGVIPDHIIKFSFDEFTGKDDKILSCTLKLINDSN